MFFTEDLLITHEGDIGTVWLLSTLGSKSSYRKVAKKDILKVSIPKACKTVSNPPVPLALRLSSNLLFGITLVYSQQLKYFFSDTSTARTKLNKSIYTKSLNAAGKNLLVQTNSYTTGNRSEVVLLNDDPLFQIDIDLLPSMSLAIGSSQHKSNANKMLNNNKMVDTQSVNLSINDDNSINDNLNLGESSSLYTGGLLDPGLHSISASFDDPTNISGYDDNFDINGDVLFEFGDDGQIIDTQVPEKNKENESSNLNQLNNQLDLDLDLELSGIDYFGENDDFGIKKRIRQSEDFDFQNENLDGSILAELDPNSSNVNNMQLKKRKLLKKIHPNLDESTTLSTNNLRSFRDCYLENMKSLIVQQRKAKPYIKKIMPYWYQLERESNPRFLHEALNIPNNDVISNEPQLEEDGNIKGFLNPNIKDGDEIEVLRNNSAAEFEFGRNNSNTNSRLSIFSNHGNSILSQQNNDVDESFYYNDFGGSYDVDISDDPKALFWQEGISTSSGGFNHLNLTRSRSGSRTSELGDMKDLLTEENMGEMKLLKGHSNMDENLEDYYGKNAAQFLKFLRSKLSTQDQVKGKRKCLRFEGMVPSMISKRDSTEVITRKEASSAFSSILFLATRDVVGIDIKKKEGTSLLTGMDFGVYLVKRY